MTTAEQVPDWLTSDNPRVVWDGALGSLDAALQGLAAGGEQASPDRVVPLTAAASAGFAYLDREGFAAVGPVILAPLAEVTYALLRAAAAGTPDDVEAAALGVCCVLGVDPESLAAS